jgi:hypothetical protein
MNLDREYRALVRRAFNAVLEDGVGIFFDLLGLLAGLAFLGSSVLAVVGSGQI